MPEVEPCAECNTRIDPEIKECPECGYNPSQKAVTSRLAVVMIGIMLTYVLPLVGSATIGVGILLLVVAYFQDISPTDEYNR